MLKTRCQSVSTFSAGRFRPASWPTSSGRGGQVVSVRRRCPHRSGHRRHEDATRPAARLFVSPVFPRLASSLRAEHAPPPLPPSKPPSPSSLAAVKTPLPASPRLHRHPLELVHLTTETVSQGRRHFFISAANRHCRRSRSCARRGRPPPELYHSFLPLPSVSLRTLDAHAKLGSDRHGLSWPAYLTQRRRNLHCHRRSPPL